ncbi:MAG: hypothetical protein IB618_01450 [Candidatus Pacearchaeota archaeon]|nr:MAG: hypothetical protein IB618_01450 [Candidatus Pacearchaeota archaeon]
MKRGLLLLSLLAFILLASSVLAYNGYYGPGLFEGLTISELAENEWVNAALLFLLIFAVCWFSLQQVFHTSPGVAFVAAFVLGLIGALGAIYYYGPIIPRIGWLVVLLALAVIFAILWNQLRGKGKTFWVILLALSLVWLLWLRPQLCPYTFPHIVCVVLDAIAIAIIIIAIFMFLIWLFNKLRKGGLGAPSIRGFREPRMPKIKPIKEEREMAKPGFWKHTLARRAETKLQRMKRKKAEEIEKRYKRLIKKAQQKASIQTTETGRRHYEELVHKLEKRKEREIRRIYGEVEREVENIAEKAARNKAARVQKMNEKYERLIREKIGRHNQQVRQAEQAAVTSEQRGDIAKAQRYRRAARYLLDHRDRDVETLRRKHQASLRRIARL